MFNYLSILVGFFYIALGGFVITYKFFLIKLENSTSLLFGVLLIAYGIFRIIRSIYRIKHKDDEL